MRALVTGGTGFIGSNIALELLRQGHEVIITGHEAEQVPKEFDNVTFLQPSFEGLDWDRIGKVDMVFHQAAINSALYKDRDEIWRANVDSTKKLFETVAKNGCKQIVYASSTAVYGNEPAPYTEDGSKKPISAYGESKLAIDTWSQSKFKEMYPDVKVVGLRYCNVYGPGESHKGKRASYISQLAKQMLQGDPKLFKHGEQRRDWIYVKDVVRANILAAKSTQSAILMCGGGRAVEFNLLLETLNSVLGLSRKAIYIDNPFIDTYQNYTECVMDKAKEVIGFVPEFTVEEGIKAYFESGQLVDMVQLKKVLQ